MPTDRIKQTLRNEGTSYWLKDAIRANLERDPVDAAADASLLASLLGEHADLCCYGPNVAEGKAKAKAERLSHFDYAIQAWINLDGIVLPCGHRQPNLACTPCQYAGHQADAVAVILGNLEDRRKEPTP